MKRMWLIASMIGVIATAQAQQRPDRERNPTERAERQTTVLTEALDLSADQQATVSDINLKYAEEVATLREKNREEREEARAAMKDIKERKEAELKEVLTEEQMEKYQEHQKKRKGRRGKKRRG